MPNKYIHFRLGSEDYAVPMGNVKEIIKLVHITKLAGAPSYIQGVAKIRDDVMVVIDLRESFNIVRDEVTEEPRIIILEIGNDNVGLYVNAVMQIISSDEVEEMPKMNGIIYQVVKLDEALIPILNVQRLIESDMLDWLRDTVIHKVEIKNTSA